MKKKRGFTLFELLVSISIIAILTAIATISYSSAQKKARDSRRIQDMGNIQKAAEMYYSQNGYKYPMSSAAFNTGTGGTLLQLFPSDPKNLAPYIYPVWSSDGTTYCYCVQMDNVTGGNASDNACTFASDSTYHCIKNQQ